MAKILTFEIFNFYNYFKVTKYNIRTWHHSMANIRICKRRITYSWASSHRLRCIRVWNMWTRESKWRRRITISRCWLSIHFVLIFTGSDILFHIFYLKNVCQGRGVQCSQWDHAMANIKIYKFRFLQIWFSLRLVAGKVGCGEPAGQCIAFLF